MTTGSHQGRITFDASGERGGEKGAGACSARSRATGRKPDDFPRRMTGFVLGLIAALALGLGNLVFLDAVSKPVRRYVGPLPEWWGLCVGLGHILVLSALPILGAGLLARRQRVEAARQTLAYSYSAVVLFAVVCGGPIEIGATLPLVLMGLGGLGGAFLVTLVEENCAL